MLPAAHAKRGRSCRRQGFFHMENIVNSFNSLYKAYRKTRCGKRDNPTAMRYRMEAIERTADLSDRLQRREYTFGPYYPFKVYEPKERLVLAIDFEGKVVQHSLCDNVLEPVFSRRFIRDNYAGQIGKGTHDGLDRLAGAMRHYFFSRKAADEEARRAAGLPYRPMEEWVYAEGWVLKGDFSKFFYTLLHAVCFEKARKALAFLSDEELIDFVEWLLWIVIDSTPDPGIPIGNQSSQLLALLYLDDFDHWLRDGLGLVYGRYMDDFYIISSDKLLLREILKKIEAYIKPLGLRPACNLSSDLLVSDNTDSDGCYTIVYNQPPTAPGTITVPSEVIGGENLSISWGQSTDPDGNHAGYKLERKVDDGTWAQIYSGSSRSYTDSITYGWTSVQYRVKAYDTAGAESAYTTSAVRTVTNNRPPVISGSDTDLGSFTTTPPSYEYTVTDADGHQVTVVEKLDTTTLRTYTATLGDTNELEITADQWLKLLNGDHTLTITATDAKNESTVRTLSFDKAMHSVEFEQTVAMAADDMPTKALVNIQGSFPTGSTLQVWICNNGNDAEPTWEDITTKALTSQKHFFTNQTKTAASWGVKIKVKLLRGSAEGDCYIQSVGGNFA